MADNRYGGYLDDRRRDNGSSIGGLAIVGALGLGAVSLVSPSFRRGAMDIAGSAGRIAANGTVRIASYLNQAGRITDRLGSTMSFLKSYNYAMDGRHPFTQFTDPERFEKRFTEMASRQIASTTRRKSTFAGGEGNPFEIEKRYDERRSKISSYIDTFYRATQRELALKDLRQTMPQHFQNGLAEILNRHQEQFVNPSTDKIKALIYQYSKQHNPTSTSAFHIDLPDVHHEEDFIQKMYKSLSDFSDRKDLRKDIVRNGGDYDGTYIQGVKGIKDSVTEGFINDSQAKKTWLSKVMGGLGYRQATVEDLLQQNDNGKWVNKLFDNDSIVRQRQSTGESYNLRVGERLARLANADSRILGLSVDHRVFVNSAGEMVDLRGIHQGLFNATSFLQKNFQIPYLRFNPLDLIHWTTIQGVKQSPSAYIMRAGTIHPGMQGAAETFSHPSLHNADAAIGPLARDYFYSNGQVRDVVSGQLVKDNVYLTPTRFGMFPRAFASMANIHRKDLRGRGPLGKLFDLGGQESESIWSRMSSVFTKFGDPNWARNRYRSLVNANIDHQPGRNTVESSYKDLYTDFHTYSTPLSYDTLQYLSRYVRGVYGSTNVDLTKLTDPREVMETLGRISHGMSNSNGRVVRDELERKITDTWYKYKDPEGFLKNQRIVTDHAPYIGGPFSAVDSHETKLVGQLEDVQRLIHQHALLQLERFSGTTVGDLIKQGIASGELNQSSMKEVRDLSILTKMQGFWHDIYKQPANKEQALKDFQGLVVHDQAFNKNFKDAIEDNSPIWAMGPGQKPPQPFGLTGHTVIGKARGGRWAINDINQRIQAGENPIMATLKSVGKVLGQPFAGRKNLGDVTTVSMAGYYLGERLDNMAAQVGLGLSQKNRGSMQSIIMNQLLRRIVLPYTAIQQFNYFDGLTHDTVSNKAADTYANMSLDTAWFKDITGLNALGKYFSGLTPGSDQLWKTPIGAVAKYGTFGLLGDTRSEEEMREYYESGEDPIRKGRWWGLGSNTPWEGGRIDRFQPNWYRRMKSDYKMTDTMYGSESEYWANNWMPTLTHPFAPLRHFLIDPNHWANKHYDDRPYPISGGISEFDMIPVAGPLLDKTVGGILNPHHKRKDLEKQHRIYQKAMNDYVKAQYESSVGPGMIQFMPAGGYQIMSQSNGFGGGFGEGLSSFDATVNPSLYAAGGGAIGNASSQSKANLAAINLGITGGAGAGIMAPARPISSLEDLRDPDVVANLTDMVNPYSGRQVSGNTWYSLTEMAGIYGFSSNMFAGVDTNKRSFALERAGYMTSYSRAWWDSEMGGLGGDLSELFRRYIPRDVRAHGYNPIRNTMPDWLPGVNYFMDFQHGDPYNKVAKGEMRLPGAAYEKLNRLHPDQFGDYGAFDRFKILADVAPYSDEYRYWKSIVSQMNTQGMLNDNEVLEYRGIRDQVAQKKSKYHFYPNTFRNAKIDKETVTVTKVIDANTFLTAEHPNNPIRLANVHIKSDALDAQQWLQQYIHEGARLQVGLDSDPLVRTRDDTMNTMHAVVYSNGQDGNPFFMSTKGESLNGLLARRKWSKSDAVTIKQENTAVGTAAFYDSADITVGKVWEATVHNVLPNLPILGPIFDKYLQVRSPLEMYKKNEVYGKSWRPWTEPIKSWVVPMIQTAASKNPLLAAAQGYGMGWLLARGPMKKGPLKWIGAAVYGTVASLRSIDEFIGNKMPGGDHYAWIPDRRKKERDINEYFDILKYMKFQGLYNRAKIEAKESEGIDIDQMLSDNDTRGQNNKKMRRYLNATKKWLSITNKLGYGSDDEIKQQLDNVRSQLRMIDANRPNQPIGPKTMQALQYKLQYESTLYGADPNGDMTKIFRALPNKDREFFTQFMTASPSERQEILRLVPKNERRFYEAKWGMDVEKPSSLSVYFASHYLPSASWEGWRPNTNLDDIKLKVVRDEGLDPTEFGMWGDDQKRSDNSGTHDIDPFKPSMMIDVARITKVLAGAGLHDVNVTMTTAPARGENRLNVGFDLVKDRTNDIMNEMKNNMGAIFS